MFFFYFRVGKLDLKASQPKNYHPGYDQMDGGDEYKEGADSPCSFDEIERPPLRQVDKYLPAQCPCISSIRYTIALMTCLGFIISFGMRCNMGMAKLQFENKVS